MFRQTKEPVRCPVGDEILGLRWIQEGCALYCADCQVTYYFKAHETVPNKSMKGKVKLPEKCGCGRCGR